MKPGLVPQTFASLLNRLDADRERAGQHYEELRRLLIRFYEWRRAPFPEDHADETIDRVARKLNDGVVIENLKAYCYEVARLVFLEVQKEPVYREVELGAVIVDPLSVDSNTEDEQETYLSCLETCLSGLPPESQSLIIEYYQDVKRTKIERRKALAENLGLKREALTNRAQRLRYRIELCIRSCVKTSSAI